MKNLIVLISLLGFVSAQSFDYIGTRKCKTCHSSKKKGAQYKVWVAGPHADAFETLKGEEAAKMAKEKGIEKPAYEAAECLVCHTTGFGAGGYEVKDASFWAQTTEKGKPTKEVKRMTGLQAVGCESCHGPGSGYKKKKIKKEIVAGTRDAASVGLLTPDNNTCIQCHNEKSPTYETFVFAEWVKEIAHPYPPEMAQ